DELFRLGPGHEGAGVAVEFELAELHRAEEVLQGFALAAAERQSPQLSQLGLGEGAVEIEVELHPVDFDDVGEEAFHVQASLLDAVALKIFSPLLERVQDRGHASVRSRSGSREG